MIWHARLYQYSKIWAIE